MATSVAWRDLTLGADPTTGQTIAKVEGWESLPPARYTNMQRARAHGSHPSPVWADQRTVTVTGSSYSAAARDALLLQLQASMGYDGDDDGEPLTITLAGRTLTAQAQLIACDPAVATGSWNFGLIGWVAQWRCPDPLRYGPTQTATTGLPTAGGGLTYPLTYPLAYGAPGTTGQMTLTNAGNADAPILFNVTGDLPAGFEISAAGRRLTYPTGVNAADITLDTAQGTVLEQGTADRRGELTNADWLVVPKGGSLTVQFTSLGDYDPTAVLIAQWADTSW